MLRSIFNYFLLCSLIVLPALACAMTPASSTLSREAFFNQLKPNIDSVNQSIMEERKQLRLCYQRWKTNHTLNDADSQRLRSLAKQYGLAISSNIPVSGDLWQGLMKRVQPVPRALVLAQSAQETGFGTSRFVEIAHNYFGQHCVTKGCGVVPLHRNPSHVFEVAKYPSARASVWAYIHNLNTHPAYAAFRNMRYDQQDQLHNPENLHRLVKTMSVYSEEGDAYPEHLWKLITVYHLMLTA